MPWPTEAGGSKAAQGRAVLVRAAVAAGRALLSILVIGSVWRLLSLAAPRILPPPEEVLPVFLVRLPGSILPHFLASAGRVGLAILLSAVAALPSGLALGRSKILDRLASPIVYILYPIPKIAFLPLLLLAFGLGDASKLALLCLILFFQLLVSVRDAAKAIEAGHLAMARLLGLPRGTMIAKIILPACLPGLFSGLRAATGTAVSVLFFAESVSASRGLGFFVMDAWMRVAYADMAAGVLALGILGLGLIALVDALEGIACPWRRPWSGVPS